MEGSHHPRPINWLERQFHFPEKGSDAGLFLRHLSVFPGRCSTALEKVPAFRLKKRHEGKWSILEQLGHLIDMDGLPSVRIKEILQGSAELSPADMENRKTWDNNYNEWNFYELCHEFAERRRELVDDFRLVPDEKWSAASFHKRLGRQMSILDLAYFQCEHDMHHFEVIQYLSSLK